MRRSSSTPRQRSEAPSIPRSGRKVASRSPATRVRGPRPPFIVRRRRGRSGAAPARSRRGPRESTGPPPAVARASASSRLRSRATGCAARASSTGNVSVMRALPLVGARQRDVAVGHVEHRVARHERGRVAVRAEAEVHEVEHGRRAGERLELAPRSARPRPGGPSGRPPPAWRGCSRRAARTRPSRLSRMCVRLRSGSPAGATRSSTWTTCTKLHGTSSSARAREHLPRRAAAADRQEEPAARRHGVPGVGGDDGRARGAPPRRRRRGPLPSQTRSFSFR